MNNLHNPIAVRVQRVQELWLKQSTAYPQTRVFVLRYEPSDAPLVEGFLALDMVFRMIHFYSLELV
mgnify:CR=1 FL=1